MRCEDAIEQIQTAGSRAGGDLRAAMTHAADCADCRSALRALEALQVFGDDISPLPSRASVERAIDRAVRAGVERRHRRGYWSGVASGVALAATVAAVALGLWLREPPGGAARGAIPEVRVALNTPQDVTVELESPEALDAAELRIELRGAVELAGYMGQRELRWSTTLDRGVNRLTLPVVALDAAGGQVLVEVAHGAKRRTFVLDVRAPAAG